MNKIVKKNSQKELNYFISSYIKEVIKCLNLIKIKEIEQIVEIINQTYINGNTIYIMGNGGSSSTSTHFACDLGKGTLSRTYSNKERRIKAISLTDNIALITAYSNDIGSNDIFIQQLKNLIQKDDIVIGISGSGNSKNVIKAIAYAKNVGAKTIGLVGFKNGGKLAETADYSIIIQSLHYGPIEDIQQILCHIISASMANIKREGNIYNDAKTNKSVPFSIK
jgi:D-sedoheptulose 7-phosphate isomerase